MSGPARRKLWEGRGWAKCLPHEESRAGGIGQRWFGVWRWGAEMLGVEAMARGDAAERRRLWCGDAAVQRRLWRGDAAVQRRLWRWGTEMLQREHTGALGAR